MLIYIILPLAAVALGIPLCRGKTGRGIYCFLMGSVFLVVSGLRFAVGYDYILYANWYNRMPLMPMEELTEWSREKGFALPIKLMADYGLDYTAMFWGIAIIISAGVFFYIYRNSSVPWVSGLFFLFSGLFFNSLNFMRQFIAGVIIMYALRYVYEKRFARFAAIIFFASVFHYSALILLPFYFILKIRLNKFTILGLSAFAFVSYAVLTPLIQLITKYFYSSYTLDNKEMSTGLTPVYTIGFFFFLLTALLLKGILINKNPRAGILIMSMYWALYFSFLGTSHGIVSRLALNFIIPPILILSADIYGSLRDLMKLTFKDLRKKQKIFFSAAAGIIILTVCSVFYGYLIAEDYNGVMPYQTVLERDYNF